MAHFIHIQFAEDGRGTIKLAVMMPTELEVDNRQLTRLSEPGTVGEGPCPLLSLPYIKGGRLCPPHY